MNIGDLILSLIADGSRLEKDVVTQADAAAGKGGLKGGQTLGSKMAEGFRKNARKIGAVAGYAIAGAIEAGATFEDQLRTINTVAGLSDDALGKLGDDVQALSRETGKSTDDLTAGLYDLVSAGVPADQAIAVLRDSAKFATGALGTTGEAVDLVTSALNAYGLEAKDSTRVTDIFAKAVADGKVTAAELGSSIANIAPIAASAGISLEEVAAGYAITTAKGVPAAQAATQMRAAIAALLTPNAQLNDLQKQTGINFADLARQKGLAVALEAIRKATNGNADAFAKSLGSVEAYQFALATTGDNAQAMASEIVDASHSAGLAQEQYDEKSKSSVEQSKRFSATLNTLAQDFGGVLGAAGPFLLTINQLAPSLRGLVSPAKLLGGILGGLAGRLGKPIIGAITGAFASAEIGTRLETLGIRAQTAWIKGMTKVDRLSGAVGGLINRVVGSGPFTKATAALGNFMGSKLGTGLAVAFAAVAIVELVKTYNDIKGALDKQADAIGQSVGRQIATGTTKSLEDSRAALQQGINDLGDVWFPDIFASDARKKLESDLAAVDAALQQRRTETWQAASIEAGKRAGEGFATGVATSTPAATKAVQEFGGEMRDDLDRAGLKEEGHRQGNLAGAATAQGIREQRDNVDTSWQSLLDAIKNAVTPTKERAKLLGYLASRELAKGLKSGDPAVRAQAEATKQTIIDRLKVLGASTRNIGKTGMEELRRAMKSKDPDIRAAATAIYNAARKPIAKIPAAGTAAGKQTTENLKDQLYAGRGPVGTAAAALAKKIATSVMRSILAAGGNVNLRPGTGPVAFATGTSYVPQDMVARVHRGEIIVPARESKAIRRGDAVLHGETSGPTGPGITNVFNVNVEGLVEARDPLEIAREMRRVASFAPALARTRPSYTTGART